MKYVGVDIGKNFHVACISDEEDTFSGTLKFNNLREGFEKFANYLKINNCSKEDTVLGLEATGHYWLTLFQKLKELRFTVHVLNPLQVSSFRNEAIRGSKTDELDCKLIAKVLRFGVRNKTSIPDEEKFKLKELSRSQLDLVQKIKSIKLKVMSVLDITFPEYDCLFSNLFGKASSMILAEYTTPEEIAKLDIAKLTEVLEQQSRKKFSQDKAFELSKQAKDSFGLKYGMEAFSLELKLLLSQVKHLEDQLEIIDGEVKGLVEGQNTKLLTIPGIGYTIAGAILGETVDFVKLDSPDPRSFLAYAGLDPQLKQSGKDKGKVKMSKRGSPYLRHAILQAALVALAHDIRFKAIYEKYISLGKPHMVALSYVAKKLTYVISAILRTNKEYRPLED